MHKVYKATATVVSE